MRRITMMVLLTLTTAHAASGQQVQVEEYVLNNGMTFLLVPRDDEPNTISCGWAAKVGSVNERPGITGITHFFEHMMFKGTTTIGTRDPEADAAFMARQKTVKDELNDLIWGMQYERHRRGEIDDPWDPANDTPQMQALRAELKTLMEQHGEIIVKNEFDRVYTNAGAGGLNAFTSYDMTFFFVNVPRNKFELWAWMESDRLSDSVFREFYAERDVVHEERRMRLESSPTGELDEQFDAMFWQSSAYAWSVIGWPSDIYSYTREQFDDYFNIYYRPNNLVAAVVGDFETEAVKPIIEEYFGRLKRGEQEPPPVVTLEIDQVAEKRLIGECECQPQVEVRYHTVPFNHRDGFPLQILAEVLNGRTGRLYKAMVEGAAIASSARAGQESRKYAGYFAFQAEAKGGASPKDLEKAWYAELERLRREPVSEHELQKVKNQVAADSFRRLQRNGALLFQLGIYEAMGGWEYINESPAKLAAVTAGDIMRVVKQYFTDTNRCVALYTRREQPAEAAQENPLAELSPEARAQVEAALQRLLAKDNPADLRMLTAAMEAQLKQTPPDFRPAVEYMIRKLHERAAELEAASGSKTESRPIPDHQ